MFRKLLSFQIIFFVFFLFFCPNTMGDESSTIKSYPIPKLTWVKINNVDVTHCLNSGSTCSDKKVKNENVKIKRGDLLKFETDSRGYVAIFLKNKKGDSNHYLQRGCIIEIDDTKHGESPLYPGINTHVPKTTWQLSIVTSTNSFDTVVRSDAHPNAKLPSDNPEDNIYFKIYTIEVETDEYIKPNRKNNSDI